MCRSVRDAAIVLGALTGVDPEDRATAASAGKSQTNYEQYCDPNGLQGARIGVVRKYFGFNDAVDALMEQAIGVHEEAGATIVDPAEYHNSGQIRRQRNNGVPVRTESGLECLSRRLGASAPVKTLKDIIAFNEHNRPKEMPYFGQDLFIKSQAKGPLTEKEYMDALGEESPTGTHRRH